jgi:long-chain acyl-CoA synthetase
LLQRWAEADPTRIAVVDAGRADASLSYAELDRRARSVAAMLADSGIEPGSRVALLTANGIGFVSAWFGTIYAGCATLPLPASSTPREIGFRLDHAACRAILVDADHAPTAAAGMEHAICNPTMLELGAAEEQRSDGAFPAEVQSDAYAMLLYTSGTSGAPKCACMTHGSLGTHTQALVEETLRLGGEDRVLGTLPLAHSYGIRATLLVPFWAGASTVIVPRFSPRRTLEVCREHGVTWIPGVPTMFRAWAEETTVPGPTSIRWCMSAGAPLAEDVRRAAQRRLNAPVRQAYGLTEANLSAVNAPPDEAIPESSGKPVAGVEIRIFSRSGVDVPPGTRGEVLVRGPNLMAGYLGDPLATDHVMRGGWLHTGDIGFLDSEGRVTIVDRSKDLILRGGASIYPSEVESALTEHPNVLEVAVVGEADRYYGEEIVAVVVADSDVGAQALDAWVRERLASYKLPRRYAFTADLPRSGSGKTLKRRLRAQLESGELQTVKVEPDG